MRELKQLRLDIGGIMKVLSDNEKQRSSQQERLKAIDVQKKECSRWDELHQLIGSADGKKFRNFAQGLTFEMMTAHANRRLAGDDGSLSPHPRRGCNPWS